MVIPQRQRELYEQLAVLRGAERKTFEEAALAMRVSSRTLKRWTQTSEYQEILRELRETWKLDSQVQIEGLAQFAISNMLELAGNTTKSEHVRYEATAKLGEWAGLGREEEKTEVDDREKMEKLWRILENRDRQLNASTQLSLPPGTTITVPREDYIDVDSRVISG
jgi:hypothetical protein